MVFLKSKITGRYITTNSPVIIKNVFGENSEEYRRAMENLEEIEDPTMIDMIKNGDRTLAVIRYRHMYPDASVKDALKVIRDMKRKMQR